MRARAALPLLLLAAACRAPSPLPADVAPASTAELRAQFNRDLGRRRLLALVSPG
jgi:hypothetical protein